MSLSAGDYAVIALYLVAITAVRVVVREVSEDDARLFPGGSVVAVVGHLLHDRRDGDEHAVVHWRAGAGLRAAAWVFLQLAFGYIVGRVLVSAALHSRVLPRRARHVVRAAAAAIRLAGEDGRVRRSS